MHRPRPSIEMRTPASVRVVIQADPVNWEPICVHNLGRSELSDGILQRFYAEVGMHRI